MGAVLGAPISEDVEPTTGSDWLVDSRGGTGTHDPGIMSASALEVPDALPSENAEQRGTQRQEGVSTGAVLGAVALPSLNRFLRVLRPIRQKPNLPTARYSRSLSEDSRLLRACSAFARVRSRGGSPFQLFEPSSCRGDARL